jgi:hypothetical protein
MVIHYSPAKVVSRSSSIVSLALSMFRNARLVKQPIPFTWGDLRPKEDRSIRLLSMVTIYLSKPIELPPKPEHQANGNAKSYDDCPT